MRIKVTGYIEADDLPFGYVDPTHEMGLSSEGYDALGSGVVPPLDDVEFEKVED